MYRCTSTSIVSPAPAKMPPSSPSSATPLPPMDSTSSRLRSLWRSSGTSQRPTRSTSIAPSAVCLNRTLKLPGEEDDDDDEERARVHLTLIHLPRWPSYLTTSSSHGEASGRFGFGLGGGLMGRLGGVGSGGGGRGLGRVGTLRRGGIFGGRRSFGGAWSP